MEISRRGWRGGGGGGAAVRAAPLRPMKIETRSLRVQTNLSRMVVS
jgi:hypothetical protein